MKRLQRPGVFGWLGALVIGLVLLIAVTSYLGGAGARTGDRGVPSVAETQNGTGAVANSAEPTPSDSFLENYNAAAHDQSIATSLGPDLTETVGFLAKFGLVLVLLYASLRALRNFTLGQQGQGSSSAQVRILETTHLSPNRALYLVNAGSKVLLLGGTDQQITFLAELAHVNLQEQSTDEMDSPFDNEVLKRGLEKLKAR